jgi:hypothetical protein
MNKLNITQKLQQNVMPHLIEEPDIEYNFLLVDSSIYKLNNIKFKDHFLQKNGVITLLKMLKNENLKYIPTDILRNHFSNMNLYIDLLEKFDEDNFLNHGTLNIIFQDCYYELLVSLNKLIDIKDD